MKFLCGAAAVSQPAADASSAGPSPRFPGRAKQALVSLDMSSDFEQNIAAESDAAALKMSNERVLAQWAVNFLRHDDSLE